VGAHDTLWSIASVRLGSALRWKELADLNYGSIQIDGGALTTDHWIRPGWTLQLPNGQQIRESSRSDWDHPPSSHDVRKMSGTPGEGPTPVVPVGGGVIGEGVISLLDRMRRVQQRHRPKGQLINLPTRGEREFEQRLRVGDENLIRDVNSALRLWTRDHVVRNRETPNLAGVVVSQRSIRLMIDTSLSRDVGGPFTIAADGRSMVLDRVEIAGGASREEHDRTGQRVAPLLMTAGTGADGLVFVNLESLSVLVVSGDPVGCEGVVRSTALELAASFWGGSFDLTLIGFDSGFEHFQRVKTLTDPASAIRTLCTRRLTGPQWLDESGYASFAQARCFDRSRKWDPYVVVCGPAVADADVAEMRDLASDPRLGMALISIGAGGEPKHPLHLWGPGPSALDLLTSVARPQRLDDAEVAHVASLVQTAANCRPALRSEEPYVNLPIPLPQVDPVTADASTTGHVDTEADEEHVTIPRMAGALRDYEVEIAVLGPVEIRGGSREFTRAWARELVVYLAMHPQGASNEAWATALWPDRIMAPSSLHSTASVARRALGMSRDGLDHLPRSHGRLKLAGSVGTDWDRFVVLADSGDGESWRSAMALVRGRPFDGLRSSDWPILEGIGPAIESTIVDVSGRLAGASLAAGDPRGAEWAARKGLLVSPYDERLYRMLMRAADLSGNPAGVESAMAELIRLVAEDVEPLDSVHPATMDLYRSLTRHRTSPTLRPRGPEDL
jgi:DNA-binding SARP family transcriptional activator